MAQLLPNHTITSQEWKLVPHVVFELLIARLKVTLVKAGHYHPSAQSGKFPRLSAEEKSLSNDIAMVVNGVALRTPWRSTCLVKALAAHQLLSKSKIAHSFHLGVQKNQQQQLTAHAWIAVAGKVIIGGEESSAFTEISRVDIS